MSYLVGNSRADEAGEDYVCARTLSEFDELIKDMCYEDYKDWMKCTGMPVDELLYFWFIVIRDEVGVIAELNKEEGRVFCIHEGRINQ